MASRKQRIFLYLTATVFLLVVALGVALPWIYGWAVPHFMRKEGIRISSVQNRPFTALTLADIRYELPQSGVSLHVGELELPHIYGFLHGALSGKDARKSILVSDWQVDITEAQPLPVADAGADADAPVKADATDATAAATDATTATAPALTPAEHLLQVRQWLYVADPWLSQIELKDGVVNAAGYTVSLPLIRWEGGSLSVQGAVEEPSEPFTLQVRRTSLPSAGLVATLELPKHHILAEVKADVPHLGTQALSASLTLQSLTGLAEGSARWVGEGWVPQAASLKTRDLAIPSEFFRIPNYAQPLLTLEASWQENSGSITVSGQAESLSAQSDPLRWNIQAGADREGFDIRALDMSGPFINGSLSEPIRITWDSLSALSAAAAEQSGVSATAEPAGAPQTPEASATDTGTTAAATAETTATTAAATTAATGTKEEKPQAADAAQELPTLRLVLDVDLSDLPVIPLGGKAGGILSLSGSELTSPELSLELSSDDLTWRALRLSSLRLRAGLRDGIAEITALELRAQDGSHVDLTARAEIATRTLERASAKGEITAQFVSTLGVELPQGQSAGFDIEARGPFTDLSHSGSVQLRHISVSAQGEPFDAEIKWAGKMLDIPTISITAEGTDLQARVQAAFYRDSETQSDRVTISEAYFKTGDYPAVSLQEPSTLTYNEAHKTLELTPFTLTSQEQGYVNARLSLPAQGQPGLISVHGAQISGRWLEIYRGEPLPFPLGIESISAELHWDSNQWLRGTFSLAAYAEPQQLQQVQLRIDASADENGIALKEFAVTQGRQSLLGLEATLPLAFRLNAQNDFEHRLLEDKPLAAAGSLNLAGPQLEAWLRERYALELIGLKGNLQVSGTAAAPQGAAELSLPLLHWPRPPEGIPAIPEVQDIRIHAGITPERLSIDSLGLELANVPIKASASIPFSIAELRALVHESRLPSVETLSADLATREIPLSAFGTSLPPMLRPQGTVRAEAHIRPGYEVSGQFDLNDASTRPLQPIGSIEAINAQINLVSRQLDIARMDAQIGAQPVNISGQVGLEDPKKPVYNLYLDGGDLPLVRSPGLILRARPDLTLRTDSAGITTLAGNLTLGKSFYTIDLASLTGPGGGGGGSSGEPARPPYFSISEPPMANWQLNLRLQGDNFLRVRTPAFEGIVSAGFNLRGPMIAPYIFGNARLDQGVVLFPFATLRVDGGGVSIRQDDPYVVRLDMSAGGRAYGYDLRMHVTGTATDPNIQFSSAPSLEQSEILMLLSTGQIPNAPERSTMSRLSGLGMFLGNNMLINLGLSDPLDDRLEVLVGEDITENDQDTITVRYRLDDDWSVIGNYDRFDAYNLDLQWTIYRD